MSNKKHQAFQNKECFSRMNFLYQSSMLMAGRNNTLAAYYGELCRNIGKKAVLRIDPDVKRNLCKRCSLALQPGITADLDGTTCGARRKRHKRRQQLTNMDEHVSLQLSCKKCGYKRGFKVDPDYKFWLEQQDSVAEVITLECNKPTVSNLCVPSQLKQTDPTDAAKVANMRVNDEGNKVNKMS